MKFSKGTKVNVALNTKLYPTYDSKNSEESISGIYWIYSDIIKNNRIRITDDPDKVDKPCMMTGWVNTSSLEVVVEE